jgi:hypothetical protein
MDEIEDQLRAWADAAAPAAVDGEPVGADEVAATSATVAKVGAPVGGDVGPSGVAPSPGPRGGRRWIAAAAAIVVVGAVVAGVAALTAEDAEPLRTADTTTTASPSPDDQLAPDPTGEVRFEVVSVGYAGEQAMGTVRSAATPEQLAALWSEVVPLGDPSRPKEQRGPNFPGPVPEVDFERQVVVAIAIPDDACPPELVRFDRDGSAITPVFEEVAKACEEPLEPKRFVVVLDRSGFDRLRLPADLTYDLPPMEVLLRPTRTGTVLVDLEQPSLSDTVVAGGMLPMTVVVSNNTGAPIDLTYCGAEFAVGLENDEVDPQLGFNRCLQQSQLAPGVTAFGVQISASYGSCVAVGPDDLQPAGMVECLPGGALPPLPPGDYRTRLYPPGGLEGVDLDVDELAITVIAP